MKGRRHGGKIVTKASSASNRRKGGGRRGEDVNGGRRGRWLKFLLDAGSTVLRKLEEMSSRKKAASLGKVSHRAMAVWKWADN